MKKIFTILLIILVGFIAYTYTKPNENESELLSQEQQSITEQIVGCYEAGNGNDVYTLEVTNQHGNTVSGNLVFDNFEKDSSSGRFVGSYNEKLLLVDYTFMSEGLTSTMEVAFWGDENGFIRGYGEVMNQGTEFVNPMMLSFERNELSVFETVECESNKEVKSFTWEYEESIENNLDGFPKNNIFLVIQYKDETSKRIMIDTLDGGCNDLSEYDQDVVPGSTQIQCYYAGLGYRFKVVQENNDYLVKRQKFEEALPNYDVPFYEYEVVTTL